MIKEELPVTVVVPVRNEEANLTRCLERLGRFSRIVVIDSSSTDRTVEIAKRFGADVFDFAWNGRFPKKRNWFLMTYPPQTPWVLFLDADEFVNDDFCDELEKALNQPDIQGFWLTYTNYFLGVALKHGLQQRKLALFRVGAGFYERIEDDCWSKLDMEVHEHPVLKGALGEISTPIDHCDYKGLAKFIERHKDYALWEARRYMVLSLDSAGRTHLTGRQKFKYRHLAKWWYPLFYFIFTYLVKRGIADGAAGYHYAAYKSWYFRTIRLLIREQLETGVSTPRKPLR